MKVGGPWQRGAMVRLAWEERDGHRWAGPLAAVGIAAGLVMALLGLPPVDLHGPLHYAGVMDPLCGGTRGVQALLQGRFGQAWGLNPAVFALVPGAGVALLREAVGRGRDRWLNLRILRRRPVLAVALLLLLALEVNQQAHADLLGSSTDAGLPTGLLVYAAAAPVAAAALTVLIVRLRSARA